MSDWISVKDRLPDENVDVLLYGRRGEYKLAERCDDGWVLDDDFSAIAYFTHWQPLPEPPEET